MSCRIRNVEWTQVGTKPINGPAVQLKGDILAATFDCACGETWRAAASDRLQMENGKFFRTFTSLTVQCPKCNDVWKFERQEYADL